MIKISVDDLLDKDLDFEKIEKIFMPYKHYTHCFLCGGIYDDNRHLVYHIPVDKHLGYSKSPVKLQQIYDITDEVCPSCMRQYDVGLFDVLKIVRSKK